MQIFQALILLETHTKFFSHGNYLIIHVFIIILQAEFLDLLSIPLRTYLVGFIEVKVILKTGSLREFNVYNSLIEQL